MKNKRCAKKNNQITEDGDGADPITKFKNTS
jgi:hypothetical protein